MINTIQLIEVIAKVLQCYPSSRLRDQGTVLHASIERSRNEPYFCNYLGFQPHPHPNLTFIVIFPCSLTSAHSATPRATSLCLCPQWFRSWDLGVKKQVFR